MFNRTVKFFKRNDQLVITTADKGNKTVIMLREEYDRKMRELFSDVSIYKILAFDTTDTLESRIRYIADTLKKSEFIDA